MAITSDIVESYRRPRAVVRRHLAGEGQEARALAVLMGACLLMFVAQWPALARAAHFEPAIPLQARMGASLMAMIFMAPLIAYGVAAASHLVARAFGGQGSFLGARVALFWSLLAISPLMLMQGLLNGFIGAGIGVSIAGALVFAAFLVIWINALVEAERR